MNDFYTTLKEELEALLPEIKTLRKDLHSHPETAWKEVETRQRLIKVLEPVDKDIHKPYIETDLVFDIREGCDDPSAEALLLRSDMDALKQDEKGDRQWISVNQGAAHSCGHDGHMSMLSGAALLVNRMIKRGFSLPRPVRFVFQPAEEIECGGSVLAEAGILEGASKVLAIHGWPSLPKGELFSKSGPFFAAAATFSTVIEGKATHGALPQNGLSPFPAAARMIDEIELISEKYRGRSIVSSCIISGGSSDNIIPGAIEIRGTIRYYNREHFREIEELFSRAGERIENQTGCKIETSYISKYKIPLYNDGEFLEALSKTLQEGSSHYQDIPGNIESTEAKTVSEDFSFYTDKRPGAMVLLGLGDETPPLHAQNFDFPEDVLYKGILLFAEAAFHLK